ncbi:thermonuclease family protein [Vibrio parahaemolyticus]
MLRTTLLVLSCLISSSVFADVNTLSVVDGDTVKYQGQRLRLQSIDTPETYKPRCESELKQGKAATARLRELIANAGNIEIIDSGRIDPYNRPLVDLILDGKNVGYTLINEGLAIEWRPGRDAWEARRRHWCGN